MLVYAGSISGRVSYIGVSMPPSDFDLHHRMTHCHWSGVRSKNALRQCGVAALRREARARDRCNGELERLMRDGRWLMHGRLGKPLPQLR